MLITNAKIITMCEKDYDNGYILIEDGLIKDVGDMDNAPHCTDILDANGKYVVPGFIDAHCHLGLIGDSIGFEGDDLNESPDPVTPHLRAIDGINMMDGYFKEARNAGVTTVVTGPGSANVIGGQLVAIKTTGKRVDDAIVKEPLAVKVAFGENPKTVHNKKNQSPITRMSTAAVLRQALYNAKCYEEKINNLNKETLQIDLKSEILLDVLQGKIPLHAHAHRVDDIFTAIRIAKEFGVQVKIVHGTEAHLIVDELLKEGIEVMVGPSLTDRCKPEMQNLTYKTASILQNAGIKVALITDHPVIPINHLLLTAQLAVKNGMSERGALRAITSDAADIANIGNIVGRICKGYHADLSIFNKNPLDFTSNICQVFILGVEI